VVVVCTYPWQEIYEFSSSWYWVLTMCGIAGVYDLAKLHSSEELKTIARGMGDSIRHRGPDEGSEWLDANAGLALAHRRLSIIDLSAAGRQPMASASGRYILAYNGEIYNFAELREQLAHVGASFRGASDTEVLLEAIAHWGAEETLPRLIGMFAFALWDREGRELVLARDRLGIKPLYWGRQGRQVFFGSELKSILAHPDFQPKVDRTALSGLVALNYVPGPQSIYADIIQLRPGCVIRINERGDSHSTSYWDAAQAAVLGTDSPHQLSDADAEEHLDSLLGDAVQRRMVADVPLGTFLSGGVDSSTVAGLMQAASASPIKTFSIGFENDEYDEARYAKAVAGHLKTDHHELYLSNREALEVIPRLPGMYCEPFADSSQIPTYLVSAMARDHVTVALSGDGGDEVFAGYNRHLVGQTLWPKVSGIPFPVRSLAARMLRCVPHSVYDRAAALIPQRRRPSQLSDKMMKVAGLMESPSLKDFYHQVVRFWHDTTSIVVDGGSNASTSAITANVPNLSAPVAWMQVLDILTYLPGDILTKVDRASMAVGLEARVPLLDHRVVEFGLSLPMDMKIRHGETKWLLRRVLDRYVPRNLIDRPKKGFGVPLDIWLRGPLRDWAEDLLSERSLAQTGLFFPAPVRQKWQRHLRGEQNEQYALWSILMAQDWYKTWISSRP
jgi:asparagine synthase (glutamine-hydrolysing)